jgi:hypothetical protein
VRLIIFFYKLQYPANNMYDAALNALLRDLAATLNSACPDNGKLATLNMLTQTLGDDSPLGKQLLVNFLANKHDAIASKDVLAFRGERVLGVEIDDIMSKLDKKTLDAVFEKMSAISMIIKLSEMIPEETAAQLSTIAESFVTNIANDPEMLKSTVSTIMSMLSSTDMSSLFDGLFPPAV